jgi:hypothetical protein
MDITTIRLVSFGGQAINDGVNFEASIPIEVSPLAEVELEDVLREDESPVYATKRRGGKLWSFRVMVKAGSISDLMKWFDPYDGEKRALVVKDSANSNKQWYVTAVTANMPLFKVNYAVVQVYADDPIWRSVDEVSTVFSITASGQTKALVNSGNKDAYLKLDIKPTAQKNGVYWRYRFPVRAFHVNNAQLPNHAIMVELNTAALVNDATVSNQINQGGGISDSDLSIPVDAAVGGGLNTAGGMCYVGTEQIRYTGISAGVMTVAADGRGWGGTTAASHADDAVMTQSLIRADGGDIRLFNQGVELDRWLSGVNTTTTKIWSEGLNWDKDAAMELAASVAGAGAVTEIAVKDTTAGRKAMERLPATGGLLEIVTSGTPEVFVFSGRDLERMTISISQRAVRGSSMAAHADEDTVRWRQFDLWIYCGNGDAEAPEVDETKKPACDLTSDNETLVFSEFGNKTGTRPFSWRLARLSSKSKKSGFYTGNRTNDADPITDMGLSLMCKQVNGVWKSETGRVVGRFQSAAGITSVAGSGEKWRKSDWADTAGVEKSKDGSNWEAVSTVTSPSAASTWQAWSLGTTALGSGYEHVQLILDGSIKGGVANNRVNLEADGMTIVLTNYLQVSVGARDDMYDLDCAFEVVETGEALSLRWPMAVDDTLYLDSVARTIMDEDGTNAYRAMSRNARRIHWLAIPPGNSTLKFTEAGAAGLAVTTHYEERNL